MFKFYFTPEPEQFGAHYLLIKKLSFNIAVASGNKNTTAKKTMAKLKINLASRARAIADTTIEHSPSFRPPLFLLCAIPLKGPKLEIFVGEFFTQSKPVWVEDLGTRK